jgi:phosphoglucosamine mutase
LFPQTLLNLETKDAAGLASNKQVINAVKNTEEQMQGRGRVLLRPSGTEPLLRIMVEGDNEAFVKQQAQQLYEDIYQIDRQVSYKTTV